MEEPNLPFDKTIKKIEFYYRLAGFNIRHGDQNPNALKTKFLYWFNFIWLNCDLAGGFYWFIDGIKTGKDFIGLTILAPCISLSTLSNFKGFFLYINEKHLHQLVHKIQKLEQIENKRPKCIEKDKVIMEEAKFLHLVINVSNFLYCMCVITFAISPMIISWVKYYQIQELELLLPFLVLYPFDPFDLKVYPLVYLHQVWSSSIVSFNIQSADLFFFTCCTFIRIQFKLLQRALENLIPERKSDLVREDEEFKAKFKELVLWHQDLIESVNILEKVYTRSTLFNFVSSSLTICLTGFNVTIVKDVAQLLTFVVFLFLSLTQVFFMCFFADLLSSASTEISDGIYKSNWYDAEPKIVRSLLIMQTRSQKPCVLTASGFAVVNLNSFMRVLSSAWSYFALLQTIYGGN